MDVSLQSLGFGGLGDDSTYAGDNGVDTSDEFSFKDALGQLAINVGTAAASVGLQSLAKGAGVNSAYAAIPAPGSAPYAAGGAPRRTMNGNPGVSSTTKFGVGTIAVAGALTVGTIALLVWAFRG